MKIYKMTVDTKVYVGRENVSLWVRADSLRQAIEKTKRHVRATFDDKRARIEGGVLVGTIDVP